MQPSDLELAKAILAHLIARKRPKRWWISGLMHSNKRTGPNVVSWGYVGNVTRGPALVVV